MLSTVFRLTLFGVMKHIESRGKVSMFSYCCPEMPRASLMLAVVSFGLFWFGCLLLLLPFAVSSFDSKNWDERVEEKTDWRSQWNPVASLAISLVCVVLDGKKNSRLPLLIVCRKWLVNAAKQTPFPPSWSPQRQAALKARNEKHTGT